MHPYDRLQRAIVGESLAEVRPLVALLVGRDRVRPAREPKSGAVVKLRETQVRAIRRTANPAPNAPLLKRMMRSRYSEPTGRGRREGYREAVPWELARRERLVSPRSRLAGARDLVWRLVFPDLHPHIRRGFARPTVRPA
jgi:hypothetical protein